MARPPTKQEMRKAARLKRLEARERFKVANKTTRSYERQLTTLANNVGKMVEQMAKKGDLTEASQILPLLRSYAQTIKPWATSVAKQMLAKVGQNNAKAWEELSLEMGQDLRQQLASTPIGETFQSLMNEQVELITSLPLKAAERVHELVMEAQVATSARAAELTESILDTGKVTRSRAMLIARTETSRATTALTQSRAMHIGAMQYIWRTSGDSDVRDSHKKLEGKTFSWDDPPVAGENGEKAHPGAIYNCFPGSVNVNVGNGYHRGWRSFYEGPLTLVLLSSGSTIEATPNHPMLTQRGWVAIKDLQLTDYLIQATEQAFLSFPKDVNDPPTTFQEIFDTLGAVITPARKPFHHFDFHDRIPQSDVDEVGTDWLLDLDLDSILAQKLRNLSLPNSDGRIGNGGIQSSGSHIGEAGVPGGCNLLPPLLDSPALILEDLGIAAPADGDPMTLEHIADGDTSGAHEVRQTLGTLTSQVSLDQLKLLITIKRSIRLLRRYSVGDRDPGSSEVLAKNYGMAADGGSNILEQITPRYRYLGIADISTRDFSGHVYTLQSSTGWFSVGDGIISKNCRCFPEVILPDEID